MRSTSNRRALATAAVALLLAAPLWGQTVQGRILLAEGDAPVAGALVALVDSAGADAARAASSPSGGFALTAPRPGRYRVSVRQIGWRTWESPPFELQAGRAVPLTLRIDAQPYALPTITVEARRTRCGVRLGAEEIVSRLLDVAQTALALAQASADAGYVSFAIEGYEARYTPAWLQTDSSSTGVRRLASWPIQAAAPDSLRRHGFVRTDGPGQAWTDVGLERGPVYYGVDAAVLFSDWFLGSHCFTVDEARGGELLVRFAPAARQRRADVQGELVLDRGSLELRRIAFRYVGLPRWVPPDEAGGEVALRRLPTGAWVPYRWRLRAPVPQLVAGRTEPRVRGWVETGGWVRSVRGRDGRIDSTLTRAVIGR